MTNYSPENGHPRNILFDPKLGFRVWVTSWIFVYSTGSRTFRTTGILKFSKRKSKFGRFLETDRYFLLIKKKTVL